MRRFVSILLLSILLVGMVVGPASAVTSVVFTAANDSRVGEDTNSDWATMRAATGDVVANDPSASSTLYCGYVLSTSTTDQYDYNFRCFITFPTATLPDDAVITAANLSIVVHYKYNNLGSLSLSVIDSTAGKPSAFAATDYAKTTFTRYADDYPYSSIAANSVYNNISLNALGKRNISLTDNTTFMLTSSADVDGTGITWASATTGGFRLQPAINNPTNIEKLYVFYDIPPTAAFTKSRPVVRIPQSVTMTDTSTNTPTGWEWSWGDGTANGTTQNPSHTYKRPGLYKITLTASNAAGQTETSSYIRVYDGFSPYRLTLPDTGCFDSTSLSFSREITEYERTMTIEKIRALC